MGRTSSLPASLYALIRCHTGWPNHRKAATDVKTRKLLTMHGGFDPKSKTLMLYTKWKKGGLLVSIKATIQHETTKVDGSSDVSDLKANTSCRINLRRKRQESRNHHRRTNP